MSGEPSRKPYPRTPIHNKSQPDLADFPKPEQITRTYPSPQDLVARLNAMGGGAAGGEGGASQNMHVLPNWGTAIVGKGEERYW